MVLLNAMADDGIFTTNAQIAAKAGASVNATAITVAETDKYVAMVEARICAETERDWLTDWAALASDIKYLLSEAGSCLCAMYAINYDLSSFPSLLQAQTMLDVLDSQARKAIKLLKNQDVKDFIV